MNYQLVTAFSFSILIPGVLALILFSKIERRYYPFIFCLFIGCANEVLSYYLTRHKMHTMINNNIYVLIESILITVYFKKAGLMENKFALLTLIVSLLLAWALETFVYGDIYSSGNYFRIFYSMLISFLSIQLLNRVLFSYHSNILTSPDFLLCLCFIIYFTYKALVQSFIIYGLTRHLYFQKKIYDILIYINLVVNLLYTLAVLWMPRKARFIMPLS